MFILFCLNETMHFAAKTPLQGIWYLHNNYSSHGYHAAWDSTALYTKLSLGEFDLEE
jgi:hypothetical protein